MIQTMNYRAGFQRLYALLTAAWIALVLLIAPADRLKFWSTDVTVSPSEVQPVPGATSPGMKGRVSEQSAKSSMSAAPSIDYDALAKQNGATSSLAPKQTKGAKTNEFGDTPVDQFGGIPVEQVPIESRWSKIRWLACVLFLPPLTGYVLLFHLLRWVYRGFRLGTSN
jgi:hypothetical protein